MARIDPKQLNLTETVVKVDRVSKVVKGGKRFSLRAIVVVGDHNGHVGMGIGKAQETPDAIRKATEDGRKHLIEVPMDGATIPYAIRTHFSSSEVMLKPAAPGTGVIAGGAVRAVIEAAGIRDILTKSFGNGTLNTVNATIKALSELKNPEEEAARRNRSVADMIGKKAAARYAAARALSQIPVAEPERERSERPRRERSERRPNRGPRTERPPRSQSGHAPFVARAEEPKETGSSEKPPVAE